MVSWTSPIIIIPVVVVGSCVICMVVSGFISYIFMLRYRLRQARTDAARLGQPATNATAGTTTATAATTPAATAAGLGMPQVIGAQRPRYVGVAIGFDGEENVIMMVSDSNEAELLRQGYPLVFSSAMTMEPMPTALAAAIATAQQRQQQQQQQQQQATAGGRRPSDATSLATSPNANPNSPSEKVNLFAMSTSEVPMFVTRARTIYGYGGASIGQFGSSSMMPPEGLGGGFEALSGSLGSPSFLILSNGGGGGVFFESENQNGERQRRWIRAVSSTDMAMRSGSSIGAGDNEEPQRRVNDGNNRSHTARIPIPGSPACASNTTAAGSNATSSSAHFNAPFAGSEDEHGGALQGGFGDARAVGVGSPVLPRTVPTHFAISITSPTTAEAEMSNKAKKPAREEGGNQALLSLLRLEKPNRGMMAGRRQSAPRQTTFPKVPISAFERNEELRAKFGLLPVEERDVSAAPSIAATMPPIASNPLSPLTVQNSLMEPLMPSPTQNSNNNAFDFNTTTTSVSSYPGSPAVLNSQLLSSGGADQNGLANDQRVQLVNSPAPTHFYFSAEQGERAESTSAFARQPSLPSEQQPRGNGTDNGDDDDGSVPPRTPPTNGVLLAHHVR